MPVSVHNNLPLRSYDRTFCVPAVTISVRSSFSQTNGVVQLLPSSRSVRQISSPVFLSYAAMNDRSSLSLTMYSRSRCKTGELADHHPVRTLNGPIGFVQSALPLMSNAKRPRLPKYAYTRSPSVAGVSDA